MMMNGWELVTFEIIREDSKVLLVVLEAEAPNEMIDLLDAEFFNGRFNSLTIGFDSVIIGYRKDFSRFFDERRKFLG